MMSLRLVIRKIDPQFVATRVFLVGVPSAQSSVARATSSISYLCPSSDDSGRSNFALISDYSHRLPAASVQPNLVIKRFKTKPTKKPRKKEDILADSENNDDEDDDDEDADENPLLADDNNVSDESEIVTIDVVSLRLDNAASKALGISRGKFDEAFYKGEVLINGQRPSKKNVDLSRGDEVILILGQNPDGEGKLYRVKRAQIVRLPDKAGTAGRLKIGVTRELTEVVLYRDEA